MKVLLSTEELSQTVLFDLAVAQGVTRVLDLQAGLHIPPVLAGITQRPSRLMTPAVLRRDVLTADESTVLLVLLPADDLDRVRREIAVLRPAANIEQLSGEIHAVQVIA